MGVAGARQAVFMPSDVSYSDLVLHDFSVEKVPRFVHMGHWDEPRPGAPTLESLAAAQERMNDVLVDLLDVDSGQVVLDAGCGLGGSVEDIDRRVVDADLIGLNLDAAQLAVADTIRPGGANRIGWLRADGCSIPMRGASVDRLLCLEALMHFGSRSLFVDEAARVLRASGRMVIADVHFASDASDVVAMTPAALSELVDRHLGPWPELYCSAADVDRMARSAGLDLVERIDATANTEPTFLIAFADDPKPTPGYDRFLHAVDVVHRIHAAGALRYLYSAYER